MALIDDLEKEGYDTTQITPDLIQSLEKEGYDTSGLKRPQTPQESQAKPSVMGSVTDMAVKAGGPMAQLGVLGLKGMNKVQEGFDKAGEMTAEGLANGVVTRQPNERSMAETVMNAAGIPSFPLRNAKPGEKPLVKTSPETAAAVGTGVAMIPDLVAAGEGIASAPELGKVGTDFIRNVAKRLATGNPRLELEAAQQALKDLPIGARQQKAVLEALDAQARKAISAAEEKAGIAMTEIPEAPKDTANFANEMKVYSKYSPDDLSQVIPLDRLQELKKTAQVARRGSLLPEENAFINQGVEKIDGAISKLAPDVGDALKQFRQVQDSLSALPEQTKAQKEILQSSIQRLRTAVKNSGDEKVRGLVKTALRYGAAGLGLGAAGKALKLF